MITDNSNRLNNRKVSSINSKYSYAMMVTRFNSLNVIMYESEFLIIGAGIVGLTIAKALLHRGVKKITIIDKESHLGCHASGRNSGVLHAGIYYPPHTLKAKLCLKGNLLMQAYCEERGLPLIRAGKVIVARSQLELPTLYQLYEHAKQNGATVEIIDEQKLAKIEPNAKTTQIALYSKDTCLVNNKAILTALQQELMQSQCVQLLFNTQLKSMEDEFTAVTSQGKFRFKQFINAGGAYADKIAQLFGLGKDYYLIPFKGIYYQLAPERAHLVRGNIYPVPNLDNPFLGVHFTKNIHGDAYVGPTAIPAFGRENYGILQGINYEGFSILWNEIKLFLLNRQFRKVALEEPKKYIPRYFFNDAKKLVKDLKLDWLIRSAKVGIRPQLISLREKKLIMDFLILKERHSLHVLNAISPAFTSSMAMADYIVDNYLA